MRLGSRASPASGHAEERPPPGSQTPPEYSPLAKSGKTTAAAGIGVDQTAFRRNSAQKRWELLHPSGRAQKLAPEAQHAPKRQPRNQMSQLQKNSETRTDLSYGYQNPPVSARLIAGATIFEINEPVTPAARESFRDGVFEGLKKGGAGELHSVSTKRKTWDSREQ